MTTTTATLASLSGPPDPQLVRIRDLVYQVAGIFQPDNKLKMLEDRCCRRMQVLSVKTLRDYYDCLTVKPIRQAELVSLLNEITIGETCFFRNMPQLDAVRNVVLPHILEARSKIPVKHLRIWSAGCSTGEEPYTLSMILLEEIAGKLKGWNFEILATDLNERSLAHCNHGVYGKYSTRNLTAYFRQKYFSIKGEDLEIRPEVKAHVNFSRLNLFDDGRMAFMKGLDLVMCANVLIYFDAASKRRVI
jgi:chemotaxis protein methyltransferase CheR